MVSRQLYEKLVLQLLNPRELIFIIDNAPEHGHLVREERYWLHFVEEKIRVLNFVIDSVRLTPKHLELMLLLC